MEKPYALELREHVAKIFKNLGKRDRQLIAINKKLDEILASPERFKPLHPPMRGLYRVHIMKSFVLTYSVNRTARTVILEDYTHHDEVYE